LFIYKKHSKNTNYVDTQLTQMDDVRHISKGEFFYDDHMNFGSVCVAPIHHAWEGKTKIYVREAN